MRLIEIKEPPKIGALRPDQLCRSQLEQAAQGHRPRRGERASQRCAAHTCLIKSFPQKLQMFLRFN